MPKKRVHEIAKANNLTSKELIDALNAAGVEVGTASSSIEEADAKRAITQLSGSKSSPKKDPPAEKPVAKAKPAAAKPDQPADKTAPAVAAKPVAPRPVKPAENAATRQPGQVTERRQTPNPAEGRRPVQPVRPAQAQGQQGRGGRPVARPAAGAGQPARPAPSGARPAPLGPKPVVRPMPSSDGLRRPVKPGEVSPANGLPVRPKPVRPASAAPAGPKVIQSADEAKAARPARPIQTSQGGLGAPRPGQGRPGQQGQGRPGQQGGRPGQQRPAGQGRPGDPRVAGRPGSDQRPGGGRPGGDPRAGGQNRSQRPAPGGARRDDRRAPGDSPAPRRSDADRRFAAGPPKPMELRSRPAVRPRQMDEAPKKSDLPQTDVPLRDLRTRKPEGGAPGAGPKIIAMPDPNEVRNQRQQAGRGGVGPDGRRRVVIDQQGGPGGGPGGPRRFGGPGGPGGGPGRRPRRRRRRQSLEEAMALPVRDNTPKVQIVKINSGSTVKEVSEYLGIAIPEVIKQLMTLGEMATLTQTLSDETILVLAETFEVEVEIVTVDDEDAQLLEFDDSDAELVTRPPVVTIMGHVDHGKTSLLDKIREAEVATGEAGGITQHIGAYQVHHEDRVVTFLDTPGHEAFTAMRARGAKATDIAIIVVAADDGPRPQTEEAIDHANAADVPIIVAVNKVDKEGADPIRVRGQMVELGLNPAEWGGDIEFVDVSAKSGTGIEDLLETIGLVADIQELKANPDAEASGVVIESRLDQGRGPVATMLVQRGTLRVGDCLVAGQQWAKVRALVDYNGERIKEAEPGTPVEILGFDGVPSAGEMVLVVANEKAARAQAAERETRLKTQALARRAGRKIALDEIFTKSREGTIKELTLILKSDVAGSLEAFEDEIAKLPQTEVFVDIVRAGVGGITESDVMLASASNAIIFGFNVRPVGEARAAADREGVEIRSYDIIYRALEDLRDAMEGMLDPELVEDTIGTVEVRQIFKASKVGNIAGCQVTDGKILRGSKVRIIRDGTVLKTTAIDTLRRFTEDVKEVANGYECGIVLKDGADLREGDILEAFQTRSVERELK